jgi:oxygen-independent coproporphyrinogen-3 oxidase
MWTYHPDLLARPVPRFTSYPTAAEFSGAVEAVAQAHALDRVTAGERVSLYVHIPFCREICWYCGCNTGRANRQQRLSAYLEALAAEIETVAAHLGGRARVERIAFGGGSPNALTPTEFASLLACLSRAFDLDRPILSIEIDPRGFAVDWAQALAAADVTHASLGVQTFDAAVQRRIGRIQSDGLIGQTVAALRGAGVRSLNFDLMYGLPGQDRASLMATLETAIALRPDRIALFGYAHVPHLLPRQRRIEAENLPDQRERFAMAALGHEWLADAGYEAVGFDHFALPHDPLATAQRDGSLRRNFQGFTDDGADSLVGLGATAISQFSDLIVQNQKNNGRYRMRALAGLLAGERGIARDAEDRRRAAIIEDLLCGRAADIDGFLDQTELAQRLQPFLDRDLARLTGSSLALTSGGRPYGRTIAALFDRFRAGQAQRFSTAI